MSYKPSLKVQELINNDWIGLEDEEWHRRTYTLAGYMQLQLQKKEEVDLSSD